MVYDQKEVYFGLYCKTCKHETLPESEEPCNSCLEEPSNTDSHRPVNWTAK